MQSIITRYRGPTATGSAKILVKATGGIRRSYSLDHERTDDQQHSDAAARFVRELGWVGTYHGGPYITSPSAAEAALWRVILPDNRRLFTMAHNIDMSNGQANIAFLGNRADVWHRLGQEMQPGMDIPAWAKASGLDWTAVKVPAIAALVGPAWDHIDATKRFAEVEGQKHVVRSDTGRPLGYVSDQYQPVQPVEVLEWFNHYIQQDDRFQLDVAGSPQERGNNLGNRVL
jgi:hypothetical protein